MPWGRGHREAWPLFLEALDHETLNTLGRAALRRPCSSTTWGMGRGKIEADGPLAVVLPPEIVEELGLEAEIGRRC